jgi:hypothetical protein
MKGLRYQGEFIAELKTSKAEKINASVSHTHTFETRAPAAYRQTGV